MKVTATTTTQTKLEGSISTAELLAFIRQTFDVPKDATAQFYIELPEGERFPLDHEDPLRFSVSWGGAHPSPEQNVPARVMTQAQGEEAAPR